MSGVFRRQLLRRGATGLAAASTVAIAGCGDPDDDDDGGGVYREEGPESASDGGDDAESSANPGTGAGGSSAG